MQRHGDSWFAISVLYYFQFSTIEINWSHTYKYFILLFKLNMMFFFSMFNYISIAIFSYINITIWLWMTYFQNRTQFFGWFTIKNWLIYSKLLIIIWFRHFYNKLFDLFINLFPSILFQHKAWIFLTIFLNSLSFRPTLKQPEKKQIELH